MNILVVEDDPRIVSFLAKGLKAEGYTATVVPDGTQALTLVGHSVDAIDLALLDLGLPGADGLTVLRALRAARTSLPVIILTARDGTDEKVAGLDAGAVDYVTKPFVFEELLARIRAALRAQDQTVGSRLQVDDLSLDLITKVAWRANRRIDLAPREWALLEFLMRNPYQILSRAQILGHVWDYDYDPGSNVVDVYIGYLRRKLNLPGLQPMIQAIRGAGYRLRPPATDPPMPTEPEPERAGRHRPRARSTNVS